MGTAPSALRLLKWRVLSHLPGDKAAYYRRRYLAWRARDDMLAALAQVQGGICIDLGANLGEYTTLMAERAGKVFAFEPDPWTAEQLRQRTADLTYVTVIEAAASTEDGTTQLFRSTAFASDPTTASQSASLLASKSNVDVDNAVEIKTVDFLRFLKDLNADIEIVKIDIEGAEVDLLEVLLNDPVCKRIKRLYVETHETRIPELAERTQALRNLARRLTVPQVNLDWK